MTTDVPAPQTLQTDDGHAILWRLFEPATVDEARGLVVIAPAIGVTQSFYKDLATWLSTQGFIALTFDYLGMGESLHTPLRRVDSDVERWAKQDANAVLRWATQTHPQLPLTWLGHSLGGQIAPLMPLASEIDAQVNVAAGNGYWRFNAERIRRISPFLWWGIIPIATAIKGYFPGKRLKIVGDIPRNAILQWRRWCTNPRYLLGDLGQPAQELFDKIQYPLHAISLDDDELMSQEGVDSLTSFFTNAPRTSTHITPATEGLSFVGHMGFFRVSSQSLWEAYLMPHLAHEKNPCV